MENLTGKTIDKDMTTMQDQSGAPAGGAVNRVTYQSDTAAEIEAIRAKYLPKETETAQRSALEKMKRLDSRTERRAQIAGLTLGIAATLVFGLGMSASLVWGQLFVGVSIGLIGLAGMMAALPIYRLVLKKERARIAPEILALSGEA